MREINRGTQYFFGCGMLGRLKEVVKEFGVDKIMLVTGRNSYEKTGIMPRVEKMLSGYKLYRHFGFSPNPSPPDLVKGAEAIHKFVPDLIIGIGGGSVMDTAKILTILPREESKAGKILRGQAPVPERKLPLILIPTTAGTGSECTHFAVVYDGVKKYSVASETFLPDCSISDPELSAAMPEKIAAASALDAFCQAVESHWAAGSTPESRRYSAESISLFRESFISFVKKRDRRNCEKMMVAAHLAGRAINITKTTGPHALSYILTMKYGIPHGHGAVLTLPEFFIFNDSASKDGLNEGVSFEEHSKRMVELRALMDSDTPEEAAKKIKSLVRKAGFPVTLSGAGVKDKKEIEEIAANVNTERLKNNPASITKEQIKELLLKIW